MPHQITKKQQTKNSQKFKPSTPTLSISSPKTVTAEGSQFFENRSTVTRDVARSRSRRRYRVTGAEERGSGTEEARL